MFSYNFKRQLCVNSYRINGIIILIVLGLWMHGKFGLLGDSTHDTIGFNTWWLYLSAYIGLDIHGQMGLYRKIWHIGLENEYNVLDL